MARKSDQSDNKLLRNCLFVSFEREKNGPLKQLLSSIKIPVGENRPFSTGVANGADPHVLFYCL